MLHTNSKFGAEIVKIFNNAVFTRKKILRQANVSKLGVANIRLGKEILREAKLFYVLFQSKTKSVNTKPWPNVALHGKGGKTVTIRKRPRLSPVRGGGGRGCSFPKCMHVKEF